MKISDRLFLLCLMFLLTVNTVWILPKIIGEVMRITISWMLVLFNTIGIYKIINERKQKRKRRTK